MESLGLLTLTAPLPVHLRLLSNRIQPHVWLLPWVCSGGRLLWWNIKTRHRHFIVEWVKGDIKNLHRLSLAITLRICLSLPVFIYLFAFCLCLSVWALSPLSFSFSLSHALSLGMLMMIVGLRVDWVLVVSSGVRQHPAEVTWLILYSPCQLPVNVYSFVVRPRLFKLSCHNASLSRNKALLYGKL